MNKFWRAVGTPVFWLTWPVLWLLLRWSHRTRLLLVCGDEFLAVKGWLSTGDWGLPGGGLHHREPVVQGLLREVKEETGIVLNSSDVTFAFQAIHKDKGLRFTYHAFTAIIAVKPVVKTQAYEIAAVEWQPISRPAVSLTQDTRALLAWWQKES